MGGRGGVGPSGREAVQAGRVVRRQIRRADDRGVMGRRGQRPKRVGLSPSCQEKPLARDARAPVPQTDTGGQVEYTKVDERTLVKELGKLAP